MSASGVLQRDPKLIDLFTDFFDQEYRDEVESFRGRTESFELDLDVLQEFDPNALEGLVEEPDKYLRNMEMALEELSFGGEVFNDTDNYKIRVVNLPEKYYIPIRDIRSDHTNKLLGIKGIASQSTGVRPKVEIGVFKCLSCGTEMEVEQTSEDIEEPHQCSNDDCGKRNFQLLIHRSETEDFQKIQVQESPDDTRGGESPENINFTIKGDRTGIVLTGRKVEAVGILRARVGQNNSSILTTHVEGNNIYVEDNENNIEITEEEREWFEELASDPNILEKLARSVAPSIEGHLMPKKGVVVQLFSGVTKHLAEGGKIRGNIHGLWIGDPGTGKSQVLKYAADLVPTNGISTSGKGSSAAGLTAAVVSDKDFAGDEKYTLKAGALVLADKGMACVDELDKMSDSDRSALHEALEQQQISVNKAGINATLQSRCSLLAAANPKYGRFEEYSDSIIEQIELPPALMSRFDLIFIIRDELDEESDREIAQTILENNRAGQRNTKQIKQLEDEYEGNIPENEKEEHTEQVNENHLTKEEFRKYVAYAQTFYPEITDDAQDFIENLYVSIRQQGKNTDTYPITARKIEAMIRITEAIARVRLKDKATVEEARQALSIMKRSMEEVGMNDEGEFDADIVESGVSSSQRERITTLNRIIESIIEENKDQGLDNVAASEEEILERVDEEGMDKEKMMHELEKLRRQGDIYEPSAGDGYLMA
jgi:replicative DNA helicase Mcm